MVNMNIVRLRPHCKANHEHEHQINGKHEHCKIGKSVQNTILGQYCALPYFYNTGPILEIVTWDLSHVRANNTKKHEHPGNSLQYWSNVLKIRQSKIMV